MRYEKGQKVPFIEIDFTATSPRFKATYFPWMDTLNSITIKMMDCVEHHKVPGEWDDEPKYDGFIFKDQDETTWNNQYPRAAYGQIDDSQNWFVRRVDQDARKMYRMQDLKHYLEAAYTGVQSLKKEEMQAEAQSLQAFIDTLIEKVKTELKLEVKVSNLKIGDDILESCCEVELIPIE